MMDEQKDTLQPETIDQVIEDSGLSLQDRQTTHLVQQLYTSSQEYTQENERSLDRIWSRMVQNQKHSVSLPTHWKRPEEKIIILKERKAMQDTHTSGVMNSSPSLLPPKKRRSPMRVVGLSLIAAIILITVISFTLVSGLLRSAAPTTGKRSNTSTGAPSQPIAISHGTLVCSFSAGPEAMLPAPPHFTKSSLSAGPEAKLPLPPDITWSSQGEIAVTNYASVKASSAQNCASTTLSQVSIQWTSGALWSPDGQKLLVGDAHDTSLYVLNSLGKIITHLSNTGVASGVYGSWSPDSTKIIFVVQGSNQQVNLVQSMDLSNGNKITTLGTFPYNTIVGPVSSDGKTALVYQEDAPGSKSLSPAIWDVTSGKKISDLPSDLGHNGLNATFSPDGSQLAVSIPGAIKIYTTDGHLQTSIADTSAANITQALAWSPNGTYIAENSNAIKIYDVAAKKLVATFGTVDAHHQIGRLAWAPDTTGIASTTIVLAGGIPEDNMVHVWKLR